jgi:hypothetical protein
MRAKQAKTMPSIFTEDESRAYHGFLEVRKFYAASAPCKGKAKAGRPREGKYGF